jgi:hypothetical protein
MTSPIWLTASGSLGNIPESTYYELQLDAYNPAGGSLTYKIISGRLPSGLSISNLGLISGIPNAVKEITSSTFVVRVTNANNAIADRTFSLTIGGLIPPVINPESGKLGSFLDGKFVDLQLTTTEPSGTLTPVFSLVGGSMPPGLTLTSGGRIYGYITPVENTQTRAITGFDASPFDLYGFEFIGDNISKNYQFSVEANDGAKIDINNYTIFVYTRSNLTADNYIALGDPSRTADSDIISADNTILTADIDSIYSPVLLTEAGNVGNLRQNSLFQFKFDAIDYDKTPLTYQISAGSLPSGLSLNSSTGWLTGTVPYGPLGSVTYTFSLNVTKQVNGITYTSETKDYNIKLMGQIDDTVEWISNSDLGSLYNGEISELQITAVTKSNRVLKYSLVDTSVGGLPAGLELLNDGTISGRTSFQLSADTTYTFTVATYDSENLVYSEKTFSITVIRRDTQPYENLYIQILPNRDQRTTYNNLLNNSDIFPIDAIYRYNDPWFGKNTLRRSLFITGLNPADVSSYVAAMSLNHYWKKINFGQVKTAQALDENFNVIYEVVYLDLIDNSANALGQSNNLSLNLPNNSANISTVYPNSFNNMSQRLANGVGYENRSILPGWMTSRQTDGHVLGFTRAFVLCYTLPNKSKEIAFRVNEILSQFSDIDFTIDRYEWDHILSDNWIKGNVPGTGTITANTQSANVTGVGTNFVYEISSNSIIYANNTVIGVVDQVVSSNLITLTANASSNITAQAFGYGHSFIINNSAQASGTITTLTTSNVVIGSDTTIAGTGNISGTVGNTVITGDQYTTFNTEVRVGKSIYVANVFVGTIASVSSANVMTLVDPLMTSITSSAFSITGDNTKFTTDLHLGDTIVSNGSVIGTVKTINSDNELILTANATIAVNDQSFTHTFKDPYTTPGQGDKYLKFPNIRIITSEFTTPEY